MKYLKNEEEAKDAVQQVFLKVLNELPKYRVSYFKSWLYMVTKNHCLMKLRDKGKYTSEINDELMATPEYADRNELVEKEQQYDQMASALLLLNKEQQECITLFYLQKKSYQQISLYTGYSVMQVKSHIQNGKRNIKLHMEKGKQHE
jgi:RNA polymerase sigma-70 factor (ECF subfamily)